MTVSCISPRPKKGRLGCKSLHGSKIMIRTVLNDRQKTAFPLDFYGNPPHIFPHSVPHFEGLSVTEPITHRPLRRAGRKPTKPPADARQLIVDLAADGWSIVGIAHRLGVDPKTFNLWLEREPSLQEAIDLGREEERRTLHNVIYRRAVEKGDATAAIMLLNSRHGYRSDHGDQPNRVSVTIALPGAMTLQQFTAGLPDKATPGAVPAIKGGDR